MSANAPQTFYPTEGISHVPVAPNQTFRVGDFVTLNTDGQAVRIFPAAGAEVNFSATPLYGVCAGKTPIDPINGGKIPVSTLHDRTVWVRWADTSGNFVNPTDANVGDYVLIRRASGTQDVMVASPHATANTAHGIVVEYNGAWVRVRLRESVFGL